MVQATAICICCGRAVPLRYKDLLGPGVWRLRSASSVCHPVPIPPGLRSLMCVPRPPKYTKPNQSVRGSRLAARGIRVACILVPWLVPRYACTLPKAGLSERPFYQYVYIYTEKIPVARQPRYSIHYRCAVCEEREVEETLRT